MPVPQGLDQDKGDVILVGAGLASALVAVRLSQLAPAPQVVIIEKSPTPFVGHTWSFHSADLDGHGRHWLEPLIAHRWARQSVQFPAFSRTLPTAYASLTSQSVLDAVDRLPNVRLVKDTAVAELLPDHVVLADGTVWRAGCVIDGRGFAGDPALTLGYQKFVGLEVETARPHGLADPVIMDATVPQIDGFRFIYCLPFAPDRLLIEDTRYSDSPDLAGAEFEEAILRYAQGRGWQVRHVLRREQGALPIALAFDADDFWRRKPADIPRIGMRAALFHPTTGYSLPQAVAVAELVADAWPVDSRSLARRIRLYALGRARNQAFYRLLNRMLFRAAAPEMRHLVLQRFYGLPQALIEDFYAGRTTLPQKLRILAGKPPVPVLAALACLRENNRSRQTER